MDHDLLSCLGMGKSLNRFLRGLLVLVLSLASLSAAYADPFTDHWLRFTGSEAAMDAHGKSLSYALLEMEIEVS